MAGDKKRKEPKERNTKNAEVNVPAVVLCGLRGVALLVVLCIGYAIAKQGGSDEGTDHRLNILVRLLFFLISQGLANDFLGNTMFQIARKIVGEPSPAGMEMTREDRASNDPSIEWPRKDLLPTEWRKYADRKGQPFFLNHVSGRRRFKDACMRFGLAMGTLLSVWCTCHWMDHRRLSNLGLTLDPFFWSEAVVGLAVGITIVGSMFVVEVALGWVRILQIGEVFDPSERFLPCFLIDVFFHLSVALNEELPIRGWMLVNFAESIHQQFGFAEATSLAFALVAESVFFVVLHLNSPGGTEIKSMANIFLGGLAGGLNVIFTKGRLGFAIGWHFGWNISMGNVFGLSTSGIPISATVVSVAPHPERERLHGGVFGPEGGFVAPFAYALGIMLLWCIYGYPEEIAIGVRS